MSIETARLLLRKPEIGDFDGYWRMKTDPEQTRFTGGVTPLSYEARRARYRSEWVDADPGTEFSVIDRRTGAYLGYCSLTVEPEGWELLYAMCREAAGHGYATEAARAVLGHAFETLGAERVWATVNPENAASERVLQKIGMRRAGETPSPEGVLMRYVMERTGDVGGEGGRGAAPPI